MIEDCSQNTIEGVRVHVHERIFVQDDAQVCVFVVVFVLEGLLANSAVFFERDRKNSRFVASCMCGIGGKSSDATCVVEKMTYYTHAHTQQRQPPD